MYEAKPTVDITFNHIRINSIASSSGVFAGCNNQCLWSSYITTQSGFGTIRGEGNTLESPYNVVTDPGSSSEMLQYLEAQIIERIGKRGV